MAGGSEGEGEDRTEAPTPRRLDKAREEGQVPLSREACTFAALLLAALTLAGAASLAGPSALRGFRDLLAGAHDLPPDHARAAVLPAALVTLAVGAAAALGGVAATLAQTRGLVSGKGLAPRPSRLSPAAGLKRLLGPDGLVEFLKTLLKIAAAGAALWPVLSAAERLPATVHLDAAALLAFLGDRGAALVTATLAAFAALAALDLLWVRFRHLRQLRMSRQELKEEHRDADGDPHLKARLKALRASRAKSRMMAAVPRAAVVVTNPTHYAVALAYEDGASAAPRIVAKGADEVAARIREAARAAGVPLVSNPPLARALFRRELETEIPAEHYQAVAEIIAFVWRRRGPAG